MDVECQCATVTFKTPTLEPIDVYCCHCSQCRRQSSSAFGTSAIFPAEGLFPLSDELREKLHIWTRPTKSGGQMDCYLCRVCGCRLFHRIRDIDGTLRPTVSIKGGSVIGLKLDKGKHVWTNSAVVDIPGPNESWPESPYTPPGEQEVLGK